MSVPRGVAKLHRKAGTHLDVVPASQAGSYMGVDLPTWQSQVADYLDGRGDRFPLLKPKNRQVNPASSRNDLE